MKMTVILISVIIGCSLAATAIVDYMHIDGYVSSYRVLTVIITLFLIVGALSFLCDASCNCKDK